MEKIQLSDTQENNLLKLLKNRKNLGIAFFFIGISGLLPIGVTFFADTETSFLSSQTYVVKGKCPI